MDTSLDSLKQYDKTTVLLEEDIMKFLDTHFLEQGFHMIVADPPHSIIYDFVTTRGKKIAKNAEMFILYFAEAKTKNENEMKSDKMGSIISPFLTNVLYAYLQ